MPEEFDPSWEYWVPDPEIEEVMYCGRGQKADILLVLSAAAFEPPHELIATVPYKRGSGYNVGYRVGRGCPDSVLLDPDPPPPVIKEKQKKVIRGECKHCGKPFDVGRYRKVYCKTCAPSSGAPRIEMATCGYCKEKFKPKLRRYSQFCSRKCAALNRSKRKFSCGCPYCGNPVQPKPSNHGSPKIYCSEKCKNYYNSRRSRQRRQERLKVNHAQSNRSARHSDQRQRFPDDRPGTKRTGT